MTGFRDIIGHEEIIAHLKSAIETGKVSHSYLLSGEAGSGKKLLANAFAAALQCEAGGTEPCMTCDSCKRAAGKNHPDIITVTHEKPGVLSVDEIRRQVVNDVVVRPYSSKRKIYIIPDANLMNEQAQNALLKTIEEPPEYAVILLLATNAQGLLPTILSRCIRLDLKVVEDEKIKKHLMEHLHVPDYQAEIDTSFAHGNVGRAEAAATSQDFAEVTQKALRLVKHLDRMDTEEMNEAIRTLAADKQKLNEYLEIFQFWFRDVLLFKASMDPGPLVFKQEINEIKQQAKERSYENIEVILESVEKTGVRLLANVNPELALELLFLNIREK